MLHTILTGKKQDYTIVSPVMNPKEFHATVIINKTNVKSINGKNILCGLNLDILESNKVAIAWTEGTEDSIHLYLMIRSAGANFEYEFQTLTDVKYQEPFKLMVTVSDLGRIVANVTTSDQHVSIITTHDNIRKGLIGSKIFPKLESPLVGDKLDIYLQTTKDLQIN